MARPSRIQIQIHDGFRDDLLPYLREIILNASTAAPSAPTLNRGGWKSDERFLARPDPAIRALRDDLRERFLIGHLTGRNPIGWAMINRLGSHHKRHQHSGSLLSGVYFVDGGETPVAPLVVEANGEEFAVDPTPGRLVMFPGPTWHRVPPYQGQAPRISIAFDVR